ncbi:MAG: hypothetical protein ACLUCF_08340 [Bifidobacterium breve]
MALRFLSTKEVSERLGVKNASVYKLPEPDVYMALLKVSYLNNQMIGMQAVLVAVLAVEGPSRRKTRRIRILQHRVTHLILIIFSPSFWQRKSILTEVFNPLNDCLGHPHHCPTSANPIQTDLALIACNP